jgi:uncharacterized protein YlxW (UPF0749 family)
MVKVFVPVLMFAMGGATYVGATGAVVAIQAGGPVLPSVLLYMLLIVLVMLIIGGLVALTVFERRNAREKDNRLEQVHLDIINDTKQENKELKNENDYLRDQLRRAGEQKNEK